MSEAKFKRLGAVQLPSLSHKKNDRLFVKFLSEIRSSTMKKPKDKTKDEEKEEKPADIAHVINLETGEEMTYLVPTVVKDNLTEQLKAGKTYVGKGYEIAKLGRREGKRYDDYAIYEVAV